MLRFGCAVCSVLKLRVYMFRGPNNMGSLVVSEVRSLHFRGVPRTPRWTGGCNHPAASLVPYSICGASNDHQIADRQRPKKCKPSSLRMSQDVHVPGCAGLGCFWKSLFQGSTVGIPVVEVHSRC